jgi:hypothetical protein
MCPKTCNTCPKDEPKEPENMSWFERFFGDFENAEIIGGNDAINGFFGNYGDYENSVNNEPTITQKPTKPSKRDKQKPFRLNSCPPRSGEIINRYMGKKVKHSQSGRRCQNWVQQWPHR